MVSTDQAGRRITFATVPFRLRVRLRPPSSVWIPTAVTYGILTAVGYNACGTGRSGKAATSSWPAQVSWKHSDAYRLSLKDTGFPGLKRLSKNNRKRTEKRGPISIFAYKSIYIWKLKYQHICKITVHHNSSSCLPVSCLFSDLVYPFIENLQFQNIV